MAAPRLIADGLWDISLGAVNVFLIDDGEMTLIDTGLPGGAEKVRAAAASIGKDLAEVRHIIVTHCHPDHAGGAAAVRRMTTASVYMHPADASMVQEGRGKRPMTPARGLLRRVMFNMFIAQASGDIEPCGIDHENRGWNRASNWRRPEGDSRPGYEHLSEGLRSLAKLAVLDFDVACFGHGKAITSQASAKFRQRWALGS